MIQAEQLQCILEALRPLAAQLPKGLRADWRNTNHFELAAPYKAEYWWLDLSEYTDTLGHMPCDSEEGKRVGLLLDLAEAVSKLQDEGLLQ